MLLREDATCVSPALLHVLPHVLLPCPTSAAAHLTVPSARCASLDAKGGALAGLAHAGDHLHGSSSRLLC